MQEAKEREQIREAILRRAENRDSIARKAQIALELIHKSRQEKEKHENENETKSKSQQEQENGSAAHRDESESEEDY